MNLPFGSNSRSLACRSGLWTAVFSAAVVMVFTGCTPPNAPVNPNATKTTTPADGGAAPAATGTSTPPATATASAVDPNGATITGSVAFKGTPPTPAPPIQMEADKNCKAMHSTPVLPDDFVLNENGTLKYTFVYVSAGLAGKSFPPSTEPVLFDQRGCRYEPHVFGVQVKQPITILNSDSTVHNVHALPKNNREFNMSMPKKDMKITKTFDRPEMRAKFKCDVHPWMLAWCHVMEHPFFSTTNDKGEFKIAGLPPGKYTLTAWHETLGESMQEIEVAAKDAKTVTFEFQGK